MGYNRGFYMITHTDGVTPFIFGNHLYDFRPVFKTREEAISFYRANCNDGSPWQVTEVAIGRA